MPDSRGRFLPGEHWRKPQVFRERTWLEREYVDKQRSAEDIGSEFGVGATAILFWIHKHGIPTRSMSETRRLKYWGATGEDNPMWGKRGAEVPNWQGGITPERQAFYSTVEWKAAVHTVRKRDRSICQCCGDKQRGRKDGARFHIHHIVSFRVRELRTEPSNLVLLCTDCHHWVHSKSNAHGLFIAEGSHGYS